VETRPCHDFCIALLPLCPQHWLPEGELDRVMEQYDTNKDGVISFDVGRGKPRTARLKHLQHIKSITATAYQEMA
jgi:hypothetical protein